MHRGWVLTLPIMPVERLARLRSPPPLTGALETVASLTTSGGDTGRFDDYFIDAKQLRGKDVYVCSWREGTVWKAMVVEQRLVAGSTREFDGASRPEAVSQAELDFSGP
ncbi:MAG: hypothetical protein ACRDGM_07070 [bacterium]